MKGLLVCSKRLLLLVDSRCCNNLSTYQLIIIIIIVFIHTDKYTYPMLHFVKIDNYDNTKNN